MPGRPSCRVGPRAGSALMPGRPSCRVSPHAGSARSAPCRVSPMPGKPHTGVSPIPGKPHTGQTSTDSTPRPKSDRNPHTPHPLINQRSSPPKIPANPGPGCPVQITNQNQLRTAPRPQNTNHNTQSLPCRGPGGSPKTTYGQQPGPQTPTKKRGACHIGGSGGSPPGQTLRAPARGPQDPEHGATPGGYGGKPPGVAFIGVSTGARNAGSGAPTGDQSTDMNATRKPPRTCQDPITSASREKCPARARRARALTTCGRVTNALMSLGGARRTRRARRSRRA